MADIEILTLNNAGDGWIDTVPNAVSTGYQAQNSNITARSLGLDLTTLIDDGTALILKAHSGVVDENGVPYTIKNDISFSYPSEGVYYVKFTAGSSPTTRNAELTTETPIWNSVKNYLETASGERVLNWVVVSEESERTVRRLNSPQVKPYSGNLAGIGRAEKRIFNSAGERTLFIAETGFYEIFLVGGGDSSLDVDFTNYGGCSATAIVKLEAGTQLNISIGSAYHDSSISSADGGVVLSMLAKASAQSGSSILGTAEFKELQTNSGGSSFTVYPSGSTTAEKRGGWGASKWCSGDERSGGFGNSSNKSGDNAHIAGGCVIQWIAH